MFRGLLLILLTTALGAADLRVAAFRADVTPAPGEPLIWTMPVKVVADPLWAKGVVIADGDQRYVLCALDWCGLGNRAHRIFRGKLAEALGTGKVAVQTVHQHTAPYVDASAYDLLRKAGAPINEFTDASLEALAERVAAAAREAATRMIPFDRVGVATTRVERVASERRLKGPNGRIVTRYSGGAKDPAMAEAPEGAIDADLRTITLAHGSRALVRLHYYATHPQTYCCDGTVSADFVGAAREAFEREEQVPQIYFTGASGNVTVGKYNDGSIRAREELAARLLAALRRAPAGTRFSPAREVAWNTAPLVLPRKSAPGYADPSPDARYRKAITAIFAARTEPLEVSALRLGEAWVVHMPGEPMLGFQRYAQSLRPDEFVAFAGYGDIAPGYLCPDRAFVEGGYEPGASNAGPGTEAAIHGALRAVLGKTEWRAGAASIDITPVKPVWMAGFAARNKPSEGVLAPLRAKALAIEDRAGRRAVMITADLIGISGAIAGRVAGRIAERHGIPRERLLFNASHTHGGPVIENFLPIAYPMSEAQWADVSAYTRELEDKLARVAAQALAALAPASLSLGYTEAPFAFNYRTRTPKGWTHAPNPSAPVDRTVPVLRVDSGGKTMAVAFGLACHPTVLGGYRFHADFPGAAQEYIEKRYPGAVALYVAGFGGDAKVHPRGTAELVRAHGETLGKAVEAALTGALAEVHGPLHAAYETVDLPFATPPARAEWQRIAETGNQFEKKRARLMIERLDRGQALPGKLPCPFQAWQFGNELTLIAVGGEAMADYALRIKREMPGRFWLAGYSNDVVAYIPSRRVLEEGGYEGGEAMVYFGHPGPFSSNIEEVVMEAVRRLAGRVRGAGVE